MHVTPSVTEQYQLLAWMPETLMMQIQQANKQAPVNTKESLRQRWRLEASHELFSLSSGSV